MHRSKQKKVMIISMNLTIVLQHATSSSGSLIILSDDVFTRLLVKAQMVAASAMQSTLSCKGKQQ